MDTNTTEEPMKLPEDHPAAVEDSRKEDAAGGDSADPDAAEGQDAPIIVVMTQLHQKMVVMTQMMIQSQLPQQTPRR